MKNEKSLFSGDNSILKYIKNLKGKWAICLLAIAGVMLLVLGGGINAPKKADVGVSGTYSGVNERFKKETEDEIKTLCTRVCGDPDPVVTVTLECGEEYVYARRSDGSYITASGDTVLLCTKSPKVCGVAVVCRNGDDYIIKKNLTELICSLLGIGTNRVFVSEAK